MCTLVVRVRVMVMVIPLFNRDEGQLSFVICLPASQTKASWTVIHPRVLKASGSKVSRIQGDLENSKLHHLSCTNKTGKLTRKTDLLKMIYNDLKLHSDSHTAGLVPKLQDVCRYSGRHQRVRRYISVSFLSGGSVN